MYVCMYVRGTQIDVKECSDFDEFFLKIELGVTKCPYDGHESDFLFYKGQIKRN